MVMGGAVRKIFEHKSEMLMFAAGLFILASIATVALTGDFVFWKIAKVFYALGVILIIFDK